ncbi:CD40 ligand [Mastacembelus armatus]|uniref:CD40 ligand n=1 Tax=Mastacembelus armatus TaxID=205130 RepID=A0A3Q3MS37_9TELE|nr:tumor necrosis factor ligand superfamily member 6-like [Mastacembelus armatus]
MINTYQTSLAPPPVPPRLHRSDRVLIPTPLPSQGHSKPLIRFLVGVVVLHLVLSVTGFIYLYQTFNMGKLPASAVQAALLASEKQETFHRPLAHVVVQKQSAKEPQESQAGYLQLDTSHSVFKETNYYHENWLTIQQSGFYYVYSKVTFSKGDSKLPLASLIKLRTNENEKEKTVMKAYCNLNSHHGSTEIPHMCSATQGQVITLVKGNQLSVWVQNLSLVDYEEGATVFGIYKL